LRTRILLLLLVLAALPLVSSGAVIAVFGNNATNTYLASLGHTVSQVTDADLATPGFLDTFDLFYMTRVSTGFGTGLSAGAAANVAAWLGGGRFVLLNADFADGILYADANVKQLTSNAVAWVLGGGSRGYIGEFNGAVSALTSNSNGFTPIGIVSGSAGPLGWTQGGSDGTLWVVQPSHPVMAGLPASFNPDGIEFGSIVTGIDPALILAAFGPEGPLYPGVIAGGGAAGAIPEPSTFALMAGGLALLLLRRRRQ